MNPRSSTLFRSRIASCLIAALLTAPMIAGAVPYLPPGKPDGLELLPPPPEPGSPEQVADLNFVRSVFDNRTAREKYAAEKEGDFDVFVFGPAIGTYFRKDRLPKTGAFFDEVNTEVQSLVKVLKNTYKRPRPCDEDPKLLDGPSPGSYGYPSRHSTAATTDAMLLSQVFPDKEQALSRIGMNLGWMRVIVGRHYPTDTFAGRVLGRAVVRELLKDPGFQHDFAEVKTELLAAKTAK